MPIYSFAHPVEDRTIDVEAENEGAAKLIAILELGLVNGADPKLFAIDGGDVPGDD